MNAFPFLRLLLLLWLIALPVWARAAEPTVPGIPNFHQVNAHVFRGAQPGEEAWRELAKLGVKTVIDLRLETEHSTAAEAKAAAAAGMRYVNVPMNGFETPQAGQIAKVLGWLDAGDTVFVHCARGKDRTGTVVAAYRISHHRWANQRALKEAVSYGLHWYEAGMKRFINDYRPVDQPTVALARSTGSEAPGPVVPAARR